MPERQEYFVQRMVAIIVRLYRGQTLRVADMVQEFGISLRTAQRDIERLSDYLHREAAGEYRLADEYRVNFDMQELRNFGRNTGLAKNFPLASGDFIRQAAGSHEPASYRVNDRHQQDMYDLQLRQNFDKLQLAVEHSSLCQFHYKDKQRTVQPYKLINSRGIWYLFAVEAGTLKNFSLHRIQFLSVLPDTFQPDSAIENRVANEDDIWLTEKTQTVLLQVDGSVVHYFERTEQLPEQEKTATLANGDVQYQAQIRHTTQLFNTVCYWIPHVRIIEPVALAAELHQRLRDYLNQGEADSTDQP